jgi:hypothetical protein
MKRKVLATLAMIMMAGSAHATVLHCGQAIVEPAEYDPNPVMGTDISFEPYTHVWTINHFRLDGSIVARQQQYGIVDWPFDAYTNDIRWTGDLLRDRQRNIHMIGTVKYTSQGIIYQEKIYNRSHGDKLETRVTARCQPVRLELPPQYPNGEPPYRGGPVSPDWDPPQTKAPAPVQQNAPVVVAPAPAAAPPVITVAPVIVIPGVTGAGQYPAPPAPTSVPAPKAEPKAEGS